MRGHAGACGGELGEPRTGAFEGQAGVGACAKAPNRAGRCFLRRIQLPGGDTVAENIGLLAL